MLRLAKEMVLNEYIDEVNEIYQNNAKLSKEAWEGLTQEAFIKLTEEIIDLDNDYKGIEIFNCSFENEKIENLILKGFLWKKVDDVLIIEILGEKYKDLINYAKKNTDINLSAFKIGCSIKNNDGIMYFENVKDIDIKNLINCVSHHLTKRVLNGESRKKVFEDLFNDNQEVKFVANALKFENDNKIYHCLLSYFDDCYHDLLGEGLLRHIEKMTHNLKKIADGQLEEIVKRKKEEELMNKLNEGKVKVWKDICGSIRLEEEIKFKKVYL